MSDVVTAQALAALGAQLTSVQSDIRDMRKDVRDLSARVPTTQAIDRVNSCLAGQCPNKAQEASPKGWLDRPIVLPLAMLAVNVILVVVLVAAFTGRKGSDLMPADLTKTVKEK